VTEAIGDTVNNTVDVTDVEERIAGSAVSETKTVANETQLKAIKTTGDAVDKTVGTADAADKLAGSSVPETNTVANEAQLKATESIGDAVNKTIEDSANVTSAVKTFCNPPPMRDSTGLASNDSRQELFDIATPSKWISEKSLHEKYKDDEIAIKLQDGSIRKRQNPDCPERTQYHEVLLEVAHLKMNAEVSATVPLSEEGYQKVAALKDDEAMLVFVRRQLDALGMRARSQGDLRGWVGWFSGTRAAQSHASMMRDLRTREWLIPNDISGSYASEALKK